MFAESQRIPVTFLENDINKLGAASCKKSIRKNKSTRTHILYLKMWVLVDLFFLINLFFLLTFTWSGP